MARNSAPARYTMRSVSAVITFWIGVVALFVVVGAPLLSGDWRVFVFAIGPALLLAWVLWIALYRPAVHYDDARAVVVNIGRTHVLPWAQVTGVRQGIGLLFDLDARKTIIAYGVPAPRPPGNIASVIDRRTRPTHDLNQDADLLEGVRSSATPSTDPIVSTWDVIPLMIGVVLVVVVVVEIVLGI
ncbi:MAG: hypothetical protein M3N46_08035 [Actinomycetota bacterium]|nr:hypothetical protein [Actinomycetota bacterium]